METTNPALVQEKNLKILGKMAKFKKILFEYRLNRAIKKANRLRKLTKYKYFVILWKNKPIAIPKRTIKNWVKRKRLKCTIQDIEKTALYITI